MGTTDTRNTRTEYVPEREIRAYQKATLRAGRVVTVSAPVGGGFMVTTADRRSRVGK